MWQLVVTAMKQDGLSVLPLSPSLLLGPPTPTSDVDGVAGRCLAVPGIGGTIYRGSISPEHETVKGGQATSCPSDVDVDTHVASRRLQVDLASLLRNQPIRSPTQIVFDFNRGSSRSECLSTRKESTSQSGRRRPKYLLESLSGEIIPPPSLRRSELHESIDVVSATESCFQGYHVSPGHGPFQLAVSPASIGELTSPDSTRRIARVAGGESPTDIPSCVIRSPLDPHGVIEPNSAAILASKTRRLSVDGQGSLLSIRTKRRRFSVNR